jgi:hypothetical protein
VGGRRGFTLGSLLIGAGLLAGVWIGRSSVSKPLEPVDDEPSLASTRNVEELTETLPVAPADEPAAPPTVGVAERPPATAPVVTAAPPVAAPPAPAPPPVAPAPAEPAPVEPAPAVATPAVPAPDPSLVSQGRVFNRDSVTSSSFDEQDVTEYDPVPDHEVTSSSFDDDDRVDLHPTGD